MSRKSMMIAAAALLGAGPAWASECGERIAEVEARIEQEAKAAVSASSGGQGVAGAREAEAVEEEEQVADEGGSGEGEAPEDAMSEEEPTPFQEEDREVAAVKSAEEAGDGGEAVMKAQALIAEAKVHDGKGDAAACEDVLANVEQLLEE